MKSIGHRYEKEYWQSIGRRQMSLSIVSASVRYVVQPSSLFIKRFSPVNKKGRFVVIDIFRKRLVLERSENGDPLSSALSA